MEFLHEGDNLVGGTKLAPAGGLVPSHDTDAGAQAGDDSSAPADEASREEAATGTFTITIPEGVQPGQQLQVNTPGGRQLLVTVPEGVGAGQQLQITG
jgi:hypothetical protein